ncbi:chemotaxis protein CheW [Clostridium coskatii]|uniref:Chemotaxis protein CheW n=1 Tax=Clostridium coskatii TaxID=1705578 RepID=A0A162NAX9_9CLOT|nr:chemotaxis protein CheW [Clostridium coskatii]OAA91179.1 Chemotaxis protein CheW [Clostridium coskatii]OBR90606.1 chemotaxis protein CheW [Clostridium coskatii]
MSEIVVDDSLVEEEDTQKNKYLTFTLEKEFYGIEIKYVIEIIGIQPISEIPELPEYIKGIINLRGKIIPVMDIRLRFKKEAIEYNDRTCIIVIQIEDIYVGLIVDGVSEVIDIPDCEIVEPPEISKVRNKFIKGIGKVQDNVKLLLNCNKLLNNGDTDSLSNI